MKTTQWSILAIAAIGSLGAGRPATAGGAVFLDAPGIQACDGTSWGGLVLGKTQQGDVRRQYKTGRGSMDSAVEIQQPKGAPVRIEALFGSHKKEAPLLAIRLEYSGRGPDLQEVATGLNTKARSYYQIGRLEDWRIVAFPERGIAAFSLTSGGQETTPLVILAPRAAIESLCAELSDNFAPVVVRVDPNAGKPRVMEFGTASASFRLDAPFTVSDREKENVEKDLREASAGGAIRYVEGAPGHYTTIVDLAYDRNRGGTLTVSCKIEGPGPYGPISASSSEYASIAAAKDGGIDPSWSYTAALLKARVEAEKQFRDTMRSQGPPPIEQVRAERWKAMVEALRSAASRA